MRDLKVIRSRCSFIAYSVAEVAPKGATQPDGAAAKPLQHHA